MSGPLRILGIDPGLAETGWGVIEKTDNRLHVLEWGSIKTAAAQVHSLRLLDIYNEIQSVIQRCKPAVGAIEKLYFSKNAKSAMPVGEARGVLCLAMAQAGLTVTEYSPNEIKQAIVGVGQAEKHQVQEMVRFILGLEKIPQPDHAADALGAAICRAYNIIRLL